jgi:thioredoxin-like negative regulator of GroEL
MIKVNETRALVAAIDGKRALVLFHASWCPYSRAFASVYEDAGAVATDWVPVEAVLDEDDNPLWDEFGIDVVPTLILFEAGRPVKRVDAHHGIGLSKNDLARILS